MKTKTRSLTPMYRWGVASRIFAAVAGGYAVASLGSICLAWILPMARVEAVVTSMMLAFVIYLLIVIACFATHTAWRAWLCVLVPAVVLGVADGILYWVHHS